MAQPSEWLEYLPYTFLDVSTLVVLIVTFALAVRYFKPKRPEKLPPLVPGGWPLLDHLPAVLKNPPHRQFNKWARDHGEVYSVRFLGETLVVVSGYAAIKEMMENDVFSTRANEQVLATIGSDQDILMAPYGEAFKKRRKFAASVFRRLGVKVSRGSIQDQIQEEASCLCAKILGYEEQPFDVSADLTTAAGNITCALVFGKRFDYGDARFRHLQKTMKNIGADITTWKFPFIHYIPGVQDRDKDIHLYSKDLQNFVRQEIDRHRLNFDPEDPRDFIDYCLLQLGSQDGGGAYLNDENMIHILLDLFIAGMDTTANTLTWIVLYMVLHQDIQEKVHAELDSVLGANKPSLAHRDLLPFTTATIMEVQRIRHIAPLLFERWTTESTCFRGFDIPKETLVVTNLQSVHMDPEAWPEPDKFDPTRFLDEDGKVVTNPPSFLPFSTGRRNCLGEQLAKMQLFLLFSTIMQRFALKLPEGASTPSTEGTLKSLAMGPAPFQLCAVPR